MKYKSKVILSALEFATEAHEGQVRKHSGLPYITHPVAVAGIVYSYGGDDNMVAAAMMHDVVEDTHVTIDELARHFSEDVVRLVDGLTNKTVLEDGNRATRKEMDRARLAKEDGRVHTVKTADLIHNGIAFIQDDPIGDFTKLWFREKDELLTVLTRGDADLHKIASLLSVKSYAL